MKSLTSVFLPLQHRLPGKCVSLVPRPPVGSHVCLCPGLLSLGLSSHCPAFSMPGSHCSQPRLLLLATRHSLASSLSCTQSPGSLDIPVGTVGLVSEPALAVLTPGMGSQLSWLSSTQTYAWDQRLIGLETQFPCLKVKRKKCVHSGEIRACRISHAWLPSYLLAHNHKRLSQPRLPGSGQVPLLPLPLSQPCHLSSLCPGSLRTGFPQGGSDDVMGVPDSRLLSHLCFGGPQLA